ncbi:MAG: hypothetical protein JW993_02465 [Sedimentisphaerales bacterium]|nr:hypothetical protein [Sedimentisphaerales bacterium]
MNDGRLRHRLALASIVLALWTTDALASASWQSLRTQEWLYSLSLDELMKLPVDFVDGGCCDDEDLWEGPVSSTTVGGVPHSGANGRVMCDETQTPPKSITWENTDNGRKQN